MIKSLKYFYGQPQSKADLRTTNEDFQVQEILPFSPSGEGEHHLVHIRKNGLNTGFVAEKLAKFADVHPRDVTFAGQKDRHAVTEQWFGIRIPGKHTPNWNGLNDEQLTVLHASRHGKKLRTGALVGNRFKIVLRNLTDVNDVTERLEKIKLQGVPNYFGEQRFGHNGKNIEMARAMFAGKKIRDRNKRSLYLSAVRSNIFNQVVSHRLTEKQLMPLAGDCVMLAGSKSYFTAETWDETLLNRLAEKDILLSAPLWGRGELTSVYEAAKLEMEGVGDLVEDCQGLAAAGLDQERRALMLKPENLQYQFDNDSVTLEFILPAGSFATSILRELADYTDVRQISRNKDETK